MNKVLMMPDFRSRNYYQSLLANSLLHEGIKVFFPNKTQRIFPIFRNVFSSNSKLFHIHWIHPFSGFSVKNKIFSLIYSIIFIFEIFLIKYFLKTKIIWTVHNLKSHISYQPHLENIVRKFFITKVSAIITHCNKSKQYIQKIYGINSDKIHTIPHGNYINCYTNKISKNNARKMLKLKKNDLVLLYFGRILPYKGINKFIKSFKKMGKVDNFKLLIVGEPLNNQIRNELVNECNNIKNIITKLRFIENDEIQIYMNASDILIFPFQQILTSGAIFLGISFGKPIIAPKLGCIPETLDENGSFLYNPHDDNGLFNALQKFISNKEKLEKMGRYNLNLAKKLDWKNIAIKTKKIYESCLN